MTWTQTTIYPANVKAYKLISEKSTFTFNQEAKSLIRQGYIPWKKLKINFPGGNILYTQGFVLLDQENMENQEEEGYEDRIF